MAKRAALKRLCAIICLRRFESCPPHKMIWQDIALTIANLIFSYALIPQVYHGFKHKKTTITKQTSTLTTIGLFTSSIAFLSLNLLFSGIVCAFNATMWALLLIQKLLYN